MENRFNPLNAELNPICHSVALLGGATIVVVSRLRVKTKIYTSAYNKYAHILKGRQFYKCPP